VVVFVVLPRFGTACLSHLQGSRCQRRIDILTLEKGSDILSPYFAINQYTHMVLTVVAMFYGLGKHWNDVCLVHRIIVHVFESCLAVIITISSV
jgi:hypothetical protein